MEAKTTWLCLREWAQNQSTITQRSASDLYSPGRVGVHLSLPVTQPNIDFSTCQVGPGPQILDHPHAHLLGPDGLPKPMP